MLVFMQMLMIPTPKGSTSRSETRIRRVGFRVESVFGASKNRKSKNAENEILDVRKIGQKVLKTTPGPS